MQRAFIFIEQISQEAVLFASQLQQFRHRGEWEWNRHLRAAAASDKVFIGIHHEAATH